MFSHQKFKKNQKTDFEVLLAKAYQDENISDKTRLEKRAVQYLIKPDLQRASKYINQALKLDIRSSRLQFLNGYIYHQMAINSDQRLLDLAAEGYMLSIRFDPTNWLPYYHLGLLCLDRRHYKKAQLNSYYSVIICLIK